MKGQKFEDFVWSHVDYFKKIYLNRDEFFVPKGKDGSDAYYVSDDAVMLWAREIAQCYVPSNKSNQLINDLLEKRGGQYSNGTLYSSSRFVAETFRSEKNRQAFLDALDIKEDAAKFQWTLEYRLPIDGLPRPAQLDLAVENDDYFIGIEGKMKEIYTSWDNDFSFAYENGKNHYLSEFSDFLNVDEKLKRKSGRFYHHTTIKGYEKCNFYYKQQICHLIAMRQKKAKENKPNKKYMFLNFVFDPRDVDPKENVAIESYAQNESAIMTFLRPHFEDDENKIEYRGLLTQKSDYLSRKTNGEYSISFAFLNDKK